MIWWDIPVQQRENMNVISFLASKSKEMDFFRWIRMMYGALERCFCALLLLLYINNILVGMFGPKFLWATATWGSTHTTSLYVAKNEFVQMGRTQVYSDWNFITSNRVTVSNSGRYYVREIGVMKGKSTVVLDLIFWGPYANFFFFFEIITHGYIL